MGGESFIIAGINVLVIVFVSCLALAVWCGIKKTKRAKTPPPYPTPQPIPRNTTWDVVGILSNVVMSLLYAPLSFACLFSVFMADYPPEDLVASQLLYAALYLFLSVPVFCIVGIVWSVIARSREKYKFSFAIQFLPFGLIAIAVILLVLSSLCS